MGTQALRAPDLADEMATKAHETELDVLFKDIVTGPAT